MRFTIYQESRPGKRSNNEDRVAYSYSKDALLMVIADGMGGHFYGEVAAQIATQSFIERFRREARSRVRDPFLFLQDALSNAHSAIRDFACARKLSDSPRTTCVACLIQDNIAHWIHVGDSRLYLLRQGKIIARTRDHSCIRLLMEKGLVNEKDAAFHPDRNKIYNCLGGQKPPSIEFSRKTPLDSGDIILLCTDGVWGVLPEKTMIASLTSGDIRAAIPLLFQTIDQSGGANADNFSAVAVHWEDAYVEHSVNDPSVISTQLVSREQITARLGTFGPPPLQKFDLTDEEIERTVTEIHNAIQKYSK